MFDEARDNLELYEIREKEILEELGRLNMDDPKREKLWKELDTNARIRKAYSDSEQERLNNNAKNDIEEAKLVIEEKKLENDKNRTKTSVIQTILYILAGVGSYCASYHMEETKQVFRDAKDWGKGLINQARR
jgi:hypothetical protein